MGYAVKLQGMPIQKASFVRTGLQYFCSASPFDNIPFTPVDYNKPYLGTTLFYINGYNRVNNVNGDWDVSINNSTTTLFKLTDYVDTTWGAHYSYIGPEYIYLKTKYNFDTYISSSIGDCGITNYPGRNANTAYLYGRLIITNFDTELFQLPKKGSYTFEKDFNYCYVGSGYGGINNTYLSYNGNPITGFINGGVYYEYGLRDTILYNIKAGDVISSTNADAGFVLFCFDQL